MSATLQPSSVALIAALVLLAMVLGRRHALLPLWVLVCLMPMGQELVVLDLHFPLFRVLLLALVLRVLLRGEAGATRWTGIDALLAAWALVAVPLGALADAPEPTLGNRLGDSYNTALAYFVARSVVRDLDDVVANVTQLAVLCLPLAALMLAERATGKNALAALGGVPELTQVRNGGLRSQGAFRHPLLAGAFGAAQVPLFIALFLVRPGRRLIAAAGVVAGLVVVATASSSGALLALVAGLMALAFWPLRRHVRSLRWAAALALLAAAALMEAPVWYLLARLSDVVGGGGWHRAWLIQQAIAHIDEWWLSGTNFTAHWGPAGDVIDADPNMMDITNHYIMEGVRGGLPRLALFVAILGSAFARIGRGAGVAGRDRPARLLVWGLGASLFAHCVTFLSVNYFDQSILVLSVLLATIAGVAGTGAPQPAPAAAGERRGAAGGRALETPA